MFVTSIGLYSFIGYLNHVHFQNKSVFREYFFLVEEMTFSCRNDFFSLNLQPENGIWTYFSEGVIVRTNTYYYNYLYWIHIKLETVSLLKVL